MEEYTPLEGQGRQMPQPPNWLLYVVVGLVSVLFIVSTIVGALNLRFKSSKFVETTKKETFLLPNNISLVSTKRVGGNSKDLTVVMLGGFPHGASIFDSLASNIQSSFSSYTVDLRGFNQSSKNLPMTQRALAEDVHQLLSQIPESQVVLVGFDIGAQVAFSVNHTKVKSKFLINGVALDVMEDILEGSSVQQSIFNTHVLPLLTRPAEFWRQESFSTWLKYSNQVDSQVLLKAWNETNAVASMTQWFKDQYELDEDEWEVRENFARSSLFVPTYYVASTESAWIKYPESVDTLVNRFGSRISVVEVKADHYAVVNDEKTKLALLDILNKL